MDLNMKTIKNSYFTDINSILLSIIIFMFLFFSGSKTYNFLKLYISTSVQYMLILFLLILLLLKNFNKIKMDWISVLLFGRTLLFTTGMFYWSDYLDSIPRYLAVICSFICYITFSNIEFKSRNEYLILKNTLVIIWLQTAGALYNALGTNDNINYIKVNIRIPLGSSNYISCFLILFLPIIIELCRNRKEKTALFLGSFIAIIMTRSVSGILCFMIYMLMLIWRNIRKKYVLFLTFVTVFLFFPFVLFIILYTRPYYFERYIHVFNNIFSGDIKTFFEAFNGRFDIYFEAIRLIKNNFFTGLGVGYMNSLNQQLAHNWILECLLQSGIGNLVFMCSIFGMVIYQFFSMRNICIGYYYSVILVLIQGIVEPNLFAFSFDFFFWMICGLGMAFSKKELENRELVEKYMPLS